jgi:predicted NUDIX family phosphoesterase
MTSESAKTDTQMILAARAKNLPPEYGATGFYPLDASSIMRTLKQAGLWIGPRSYLELDPAYRQTIPYVLLQMDGQLVRYTRTIAGGESRLHGRMSIGLGGHVDLSDVASSGASIDLEATLMSAAKREVFEELGDVECVTREWIGILLDNDSDVGRVHIGVVGLWTLRSFPLGSAEEAVAEVTLCSFDQLIRHHHDLESWSQLMLNHLGSARRCQATLPPPPPCS